MFNVTKLMSKNHVWNGFLGVDNYSEVHSLTVFKQHSVTIQPQKLSKSKFLDLVTFRAVLFFPRHKVTFRAMALNVTFQFKKKSNS